MVEEPPRFYGALAVAEAERSTARLIESALYSLGGYVDQFESALTLFDSCPSTRGPERGWVFIAARDGAMTIFHLGEALNGIWASTRECPTLEAMVDLEVRKQASGLFAKAFPKWENVRHSVAHDSIKLKTPKKYEEHAIKGDLSTPSLHVVGVHGLTISNELFGRTFSNSWKGALFSYDISADSLARLQEVRALVWKAFRAAETANLEAAKSARRTGR